MYPPSLLFCCAHIEIIIIMSAVMIIHSMWFLMLLSGFHSGLASRRMETGVGYDEVETDERSTIWYYLVRATQ